jgi:hypothetical protein
MQPAGFELVLNRAVQGGSRSWPLDSGPPAGQGGESAGPQSANGSLPKTPEFEYRSIKSREQDVPKLLVPPAIFMIILGEVTNTSVHVLIIQLAELQNAATGDTGCRQRSTGIWLPLA